MSRRIRSFVHDVRWAYSMSKEFWPNGHWRRVIRYARLRIQVSR